MPRVKKELVKVNVKFPKNSVGPHSIDPYSPDSPLIKSRSASDNSEKENKN